MIILDLNQVMLSNLLVQIGNHTNTKVEEGMVRHMVLNAIRSFRTKFSAEFGEIVIACDNKNCWRREVFPYYKANRKKARESSELNWNEIFECLGKIRQELKDFFPYKVIDIETAEADDIIATLVHTFGSEFNAGEKILILSGDKDFIQLHKYANVQQYDPVRKKFITHNSPSRFLAEHILKGDAGDGVPNVLSDDACFVLGERQKPLTTKRIEEYIVMSVEDMPEKIRRNYMRNAQIIDLSFVPETLCEKIKQSYNEQNDKNRSKLFDYFVKNRLKMLMEHINEF